MIISHAHGFIFLKTRKTAGSSIEATLYPHLGPDDIITGSDRDGTPRRNVDADFSGHEGWRRIRDLAGEDNFRSYYRFCIERNPWDKTVSDWLYKRDVLGAFAGGLGEYMVKDAPTEWHKYAKREHLIFEPHRFEDLGWLFPKLCRQIGLPPIGLVHRLKVNPSRDDYRRYYDDETRDRVAEMFAREIEHFGYSF